MNNPTYIHRHYNIAIMNPIKNYNGYRNSLFLTTKTTIMRQITIFIALFSICATLVANNPYSSGETLNVVANSGLKLRVSPELSGEVISIIPFGEAVEVLENNEETNTQVLNYVSGQWLLVNYDGQTGYVFDGYLSSLAIPMYEFEMIENNQGFMSSLESWTNFRYISTDKADTLQSKNGMTKVIQNYHNGAKMTQVYNDSYYQLIIELDGIRVMDAYHLLQNMITSKTAKENFVEKSIFITSDNGETERININLEEQTIIEKLPNGSVKIRLLQYNQGC